MAGSTERAVLAGGCFWGMQDLIRRYPGRRLDPGRLHRRRGSQRHVSQPRQSRRGDRDHLRSRRRSATARCSNSSFRSTTPPPATARATMSARATGRPSSTTTDEQKRVALDTIADVNASGPVAGQGGYGSRARGPVLAGRARASGLSRALSERLHLPLSPRQLGAAEAGRRRGINASETPTGRGDPGWEGLQLPWIAASPGSAAWSPWDLISRRARAPASGGLRKGCPNVDRRDGSSGGDDRRNDGGNTGDGWSSSCRSPRRQRRPRPPRPDRQQRLRQRRPRPLPSPPRPDRRARPKKTRRSSVAAATPSIHRLMITSIGCSGWR